MSENAKQSADEVQGIDYPFVWTPADRSRVVPGAMVESVIGTRGVHRRERVCLTGAVAWSSERFGGAEVSCFVPTNPKMRFLLPIGELDPASLRDPTPETTAAAIVAEAVKKPESQPSEPLSAATGGRHVGGQREGKTYSTTTSGFTWTAEQRKKLVRGASFYLNSGRDRYVVFDSVHENDVWVKCQVGSHVRSLVTVYLSRIDPNFVYPPEAPIASAADAHTQRASEIYGVPITAVTPKMRERAKAIGFLENYRVRARALSDGAVITQHEGEEPVFTDIAQWQKQLRAQWDKATGGVTIDQETTPSPPSEAPKHAKRDGVTAGHLPPTACCAQKAKYGDSHSLGCVNRREESKRREWIGASNVAQTLERGAVLYNEVEDAQLIAADEGRAIWGAGWRK